MSERETQHHLAMVKTTNPKAEGVKMVNFKENYAQVKELFRNGDKQEAVNTILQ